MLYRICNILIIWLIVLGCSSTGKELVVSNEKPQTLEVFPDWKANWIGADVGQDTLNTWVCFQKSFDLPKLDSQNWIARVAADSKYWLWVNGKMVVFEGGLKRGPTANDSYYDKVDLTDFLKEGPNSIAILLWYFGKDGFSHKDSGQAGLLFDLQSNEYELLSDGTWRAWLHPAYTETEAPFPNYRLPESNVAFDASKGDFDFIKSDYSANEHPYAKVLGNAEGKPWGKLVERPIPQWKDFGLKSFKNQKSFPFISNGDTIKLKLPYNAQVTPYLEIDASQGKTIHMLTSNYRGGGPPNVRATYTTKQGQQSYESLGWMNGESLYFVIPEGITVYDLAYRETGYDTEFTGSLSCDDDFYNRLWQKSLRTLYVTMRDNYMDCPDRERAQWWGDEVLESGEAFYALSPSSNLLVKKGILELANWQRNDSTMYSPIPAGNWHNELPTQMLSSIGTYGFWNYYWHTGDKETLKEVYDEVQKYLGLWQLKDNGLVAERQVGWTWGDWGDNKDMPIIFNTQYYMALDSFKRMSELLGYHEKALELESKMIQFKQDFNREFWTGKSYRSPEYEGLTDDRSQGLSVVAGLADRDKFEAILDVLKNERHASPYMEKYVLEAMFIMGYPSEALDRMKLRFSTMVNHPDYTTLWEGWGIGQEGFGGGTTNHAWSGGGLTLLSQYVAGIYPIAPGYERFQVKPQLGYLNNVSAVVPSIKGDIEVDIERARTFIIELSVPKGTAAEVLLPNEFSEVSITNSSGVVSKLAYREKIVLKPGTYKLEAI